MQNEVYELLPPAIFTEIKGMVASLSTDNAIEEIRLRVGRPVELVGPDVFLPSVVTRSDLDYVLSGVTQSSMYAVEDELRNGYITIKGGHRIGIAGRVVKENRGMIKTLRDISSVNIRVAMAHQGGAQILLPWMLSPLQKVLSTLIIGPPCSGKTTLLRDLARQLGDGTFMSMLKPQHVAVVDERSEIAAVYDGVPAFAIGKATDVLDNCDKALGMIVMLRAMAPDVIITDEIGSAGDVVAILEMARSGVTFIGTLHANSIDDLKARTTLSPLFQDKTIERFIFIERLHRQTVVRKVYDRHLRLILPG